MCSHRQLPNTSSKLYSSWWAALLKGTPTNLFPKMEKYIRKGGSQAQWERSHQAKRKSPLFFLFLRPFPLSRFSVFATFLFRSPPLSASIMLRLSFLPLLVSLSVSFPLLSLPGSLVFLPPTSACTAPKAQSPRSDNAQNNYKTIIKQL